ncbi:hypothetical protein D3C86_1527220 [compost metagenome]
MDGDGHMVGIVECGGRTIEGLVAEFPGRRCRLPDQAHEVAGVGGIARTAAFRREIELIPPGEFRLGRKRLPVDLLAADKIAADRYEPGATFGPECGHDVGGASAPVITGHDGLLDAERVEKGDHVDRKRRLLSVACGVVREKTGRAISAQIGDEYPISSRCKDGRDIDIAVDVVWPSVQQQHDRAVCGAGFCITDAEYARFNLLQGAKGGGSVASG